MQLIVDVQTVGNSWQVQILDATTKSAMLCPETGMPLLPQPRLLRRVGDGPRAFPLPPEAEASTISADALHYPLCNPPSEEMLIDIYSDIVHGGRLSGNRIEQFGRYLFATLFGDDLWARIDRAAGTNYLELALCCQDTDQGMNRLPWEMMHGPQGFLAAEAQVTIVRMVPDTNRRTSEIAAPPRVLFVVGTALTNSDIRPGAEYLGLLRGLRQAGLSLKTHLLLQATSRKVEAAIKLFRPAVVHFICHGEFRNGQSYLQLVDNEDVSTTVDVGVENLLQILRTDQNLPLPQIVVLNACYTATADLWEVGQIATPLAVKLIRGDRQSGIPIVVGMAGRVADQACRLFTRRFYEALLEGGEIANAAAEGRRAGIRHGTDPRETVDWALPTLFLSYGVTDARLSITGPDHEEQQWYQGADQYAPPGYPVFCDRLGLFHWYDLLMTDDVTQIASSQRQSNLQVIAVSVNQADNSLDSVPRYGRTRLLKELAAQAAWEGHVPCLVTAEEVVPDGQWPKDLRTLLQAIMWAASITATHFELEPQPWDHVQTLLEMNPGDQLPERFPQEIKTLYRMSSRDPVDARVIAVAFRLDLLKFLHTFRLLRARCPTAESDRTKLLLLIDDVHRMGEAASHLLHHLLGPFGLGRARRDVRVIFTYASIPAFGQETTVHVIDDWLGKSKWVESLPLEKFSRPLEEVLAYEHFLFHWEDDHEQNEGRRKKPLTVAGTDDDLFVQRFFETLSKEVEGIPSNLERKAPIVIRTYLNLPRRVLREANDEDALLAIQQIRRR